MSLPHVQAEESYSRPDICILLKSSYLDGVEKYYVKPLKALLSSLKIQVIGLPYIGNKLVPEGLTEALNECEAPFIYVADASAFKRLTKKAKADSELGYIHQVKLKGYEDLVCTYGISYGQLLHNTNAASRLKLSLELMVDYLKGSYTAIGEDLLKDSHILESEEEIQLFLENALNEPIWALDIETHSLKHYKANMASIAFSDGIRAYSFITYGSKVRKLLKNFLEAYTGKLLFHNASYDVKVLIYTLWMNHVKDWENLLKGLHRMCEMVEDTMIMAYLCINSTANYSLSLKDLAHEYAGNYAIDVTDISKLDTETLLRYNMVDTLATFYLYKKYSPLLIQEEQEEIYRELMLPTLKVLIQTELSGMPLNSKRVNRLKESMENQKEELLGRIYSHPLVQETVLLLREKEATKKNAVLKKKRVTAEEMKVEFNLNSNHHLNVLLHEVANLPILDRTPTGMGEVGSDALTTLKNHAGKTVVPLLDDIVEYIGIEKILSTFIPQFVDAYPNRDGRSYLYGSFKIGGTISGRLSSSSPNLQNLPSGSKYGKAIKKCFMANNDTEIMVGADFSALIARAA